MSYLSVAAQLGSPESWVEWISNVKVMRSATLVFRLRNSVAVTPNPPLPGWPSGEGLIEATSNSIFVPSGSGLRAVAGGGSSQAVSGVARFMVAAEDSSPGSGCQ